jgi:two-component system OmpR family sensor kinase
MSTRARFTVSNALLIAIGITLFAVVLYFARTSVATSETAGRSAEIADRLVQLLQGAASERRVLAQVDTTGFAPVVRATNEIQTLFDAQPAYIFVFGTDGRSLYWSPLARLLPSVSFDTLVYYGKQLEPGTVGVSVPIALDQRRITRVVLVARNPQVSPHIGKVVAGYPTEAAELPAQLLVGTMLAVAPLVLLISLVPAYLAARSAFKPVQQIIDNVEAISDGRSLHRRLPSDHGNDELARLSATLNAMLARLEQSFSGLRRFTADASHELKTPLTVLRADVERSMHPGTSRNDRMVALEEALQEITRMSDLVDSLLTLARADEGRFDLVREPVHLGPLLRDVFETALILSENAELTTVMSGESDVVVLGDETRLRHLFLNLLTNAIKYTPKKGRVDLVVSRRSEGEVSIAVRDTGIGIAALDLPHVFDRFWRADRARSRAAERGGFGLGLAIAQWIVQAHGGTLTVQSRLGRGSIFTVVLPVVEDVSPAAEPASEAPVAAAQVPEAGEPNSDFTNS